MMVAKHFLDFYVKSSLHVSLCYIAFYAVVSAHAGFTPGWIELTAIGTATLVGYNVAKYIHLLNEKFPYHYPIKLLTFLCSLVASITVIELGMRAFALFAFCTILTSLYSLPELLGKSFREIPILKLITIGASWSILAVLLPYAIQTDSIEELLNVINNEGIYGRLIQYSLFVIALCIPFEIRDLKYDPPKLRTLPQVVGTQNSEIIGLVLIAICALLEYLMASGFNVHGIITYIILAITALAIMGSDKIKSDYYASFFVEAIPALWLVLILLSSD
ncbi:UbiA prenyltransferase family protein [Nonlabens agnitus]|uniref:Prenyltransferase n=1 Tax=Nonlabens agnitus TaxID=870484 RepID=A0A2S9WRT2_9FLAO|nr:hypothetical protein [Nonlabens agnitus]PRP66159.1 hypothetical protein BST86_03170 [Nonlabens agnitus]